MALHDVDKGNLNRSAPMPNVHNQIPEDAVKAHNTASSHYSLNNPTGYLQQRNQQFIANDGTNNKALFGFNQALSKWGFFVADDGVDVTTNADLSKLIFNSSQDVFKIVKTGTAVINIPNSNNDFLSTTTVNHNLNFVPAYIAFVSPPAGFSAAPANAQLPFFFYSLYDSTNTVTVQGWHIVGLADVSKLTTTQIIFRLSMVQNYSMCVGNWTFTYYLLQETVTSS